MEYHRKKFKSRTKWRKGKIPKEPCRYAKFLEKIEEEKIFAIEADKYWADITPLLQSMQKEFSNLDKPPRCGLVKENIKYCIQIFGIISKYQDLLENGLSIVPRNKKKIAQAFNNDLYYAGRHTIRDFRKDSVHGYVPYWNTTMPGQMITEDNIYFGPELGLSRKPASYWLGLSKKKKITFETIKTYDKGIVPGSNATMWQTEALVKFGIHHFNETAFTAFSNRLNELLA